MPADREKDKHEDAPAAPVKKGKGMLIGIIAAVIIAVGAGGFFFMKGKPGAKAEGGHSNEEVASSQGGGEGQEKKSGSIFNLEPFIVNLQDNSGTRYLKLTINLELAPNTSSEELSAQTPQIRDSLIILLSSKGYSDIGTVEGKYQMRDEIVARVNQFLHRGKVKTAYFTEFVIQ
ncbi:MAG TPA: flagellar basal body-associated FliL family protein [Thermodesulfobacteriota bacterium]|nr:flagellar basal body-associated FliL family protein [Thermodesulfobacteriota bacterium]